MLFDPITPEQAGVKSARIQRMIAFLEQNGLVLHSLLLMKGENIFGEFYWKPFHRDYCHRMYSQTKSYVGIAIGLLQEEGKLQIEDPILKYFPKEAETVTDPYLKRQTIRDMLTMRTCLKAPRWFGSKDGDRVDQYFHRSDIRHPSSTMWEYDSPGSQVLSVLVERLSGKPLLTYLTEKIFSHLGTFRSAELLKTPTGDSWGDSALICTTRDMASYALLLSKNGNWKGKQLIPEDYVKEATSHIADNHDNAYHSYDQCGYGYQIWRYPMNGFGFNGMGGQYTIAVPQQDLVICCTGDNQGYPSAGSLFFAAVKEFITEDMADHPLPPDPDAVAALQTVAADLKLAISDGAAHSPFTQALNGKTYIFEHAPFGWKWCSFTFDGEEGILRYENAQGEKTLPFGLGKNVFCPFPQLGYSQDVGGTRDGTGRCYHCASSAGWAEEKKLLLRVQIIDRYFGNLFVSFSFREEEVTVSMVRNAENFLAEYQGEAVGVLQK